MAEETNQQSDQPVQAPLLADSPADGFALPLSAERGDTDGENEAIAPVAALADSFSPETVLLDEPSEEAPSSAETTTTATATLTEMAVAEGVVQQVVPEPSKVAPAETIKETVKEVSGERTVVKEVVGEMPVETVREVIKEAPVEKVIIKEVIKEVPVVKEIIKEVVREVIKEVPVEKVIIKEVIKEMPVIKEVVKEIRVIDQEGAQRLVEEKLKQRQRDNSLLGNKKRKERREGNLNKILGKTREGGSADSQAVRNLLRVSKRTAAYYLKELVGRGLLKKERKGRRIIYKT